MIKTDTAAAALSAGAASAAPSVEDEKGFAPFEEAQHRAGDPARSTLYSWIAAGLFPAPRQLGPNRVGWLRSELAEWEWNRPSASIGVKDQWEAPAALPTAGAKIGQPAKAEPRVPVVPMSRRARRDPKGSAPPTQPPRAA